MADAWLPKEEYIALRKEVQGATAELARLELACVLAVAALFAWLVRGAGGFRRLPGARVDGPDPCPGLWRLEGLGRPRSNGPSPKLPDQAGGLRIAWGGAVAGLSGADAFQGPQHGSARSLGFPAGVHAGGQCTRFHGFSRAMPWTAAQRVYSGR